MVMRKRETYQLEGNNLIYPQILNSLSKEKYESNTDQILGVIELNKYTCF